MGLPVEKSAPTATSGLRYISTPRLEQDFRAKWDSYGRAKIADPQTGDFFNRQAHYRNHFFHFSA
jgi:hypothetical protein